MTRSPWRLLTVLCVVYRVAYLDLGSAEDDGGSGSGNGSNDTAREGGGPPLSAEAIANISASAAVLFVMGSAICYLILCFNKEERMERVRMAQERNRQITRRMEEAVQKRRMRQEQQQQQQGGTSQVQVEGEEEEKAVGGFLFSQSHHSHEIETTTSRDIETSPTQPLVPSSLSDINSPLHRSS